MSATRLLRGEAAEALRRARKACSLAHREAKAVGEVRCEFLKRNELRKAKDACDRVAKAAEEARAAYLRARPPRSEKKARSATKSKERRELVRRDAVARVQDTHQVPARVAELATRRAEKRGNLPRNGQRWAILADRVTETDLAHAWDAYEKEQEREASREFKRRRRQPEHDVEILPVPAGSAVYEVDVPF